MFKQDIPLSSYTTFKIGGPADYFCQVEDSAKLAKAVRFAQNRGIPYVVLGRGSNILIPDQGFRGLVIRNQIRAKELKIKNRGEELQKLEIRPRLEQIDEEQFYIFEDLIRENSGEPVLVEVESGFNLEELAKILFKEGVVGLESFAGIPGTVGGAVYGNSHGGTKFFGEYVAGAKILTKDGEVREVDQDFFGFAYDYSSLKENGAVVLSIILQLQRGDGRKAQQVFETWKERKIRQPKRSAGCIFQNVSPEEQVKLGIPTNSIGFIIDRILGLKGTRIGDAEISSYHGAFIVNRGKASASDVRKLIELCKEKAGEKLGLELKEEIVYVGF